MCGPVGRDCTLSHLPLDEAEWKTLAGPDCADILPVNTRRILLSGLPRAHGVLIVCSQRIREQSVTLSCRGDAV
jgi:hypothetical protein